MTMDRRGFLYAGGFAATASAIASPVHAAPVTSRSVTDYGVERNAKHDQTEVLQNAINAISATGQAVLFPGGTYQAKMLTLPRACALIGEPGPTRLALDGLTLSEPKDVVGAPVFIHGIVFERISKGQGPLVSIDGGAAVEISSCTFAGKSGTGLKVTGGQGTLRALRVLGFPEHGIAVAGAAGGDAAFVITDNIVSGCGTGIAVSAAGVAVSQNLIDECAVGISADGSGILSGNFVTTASRYGLKLGSAKGSGHILAQSNLLRDCRIGIGVAASGDDIMASLNMITGAKDGAIRAFDGEKIVGPDLARQSAEAYLNLMVAGNVVR